jgi:Beta propeller domain
MHSVVTCDLANAEPTCNSRSVLAGYSRTFYVSPRAVYLWTQEMATNPDTLETMQDASLYQMPFDDSKPARVRVKGQPVDQFSFLEGSDEYLNVVVRGQSQGDGMWNPETNSGKTAMLRFSTSKFDGEDRAVENESYADLPSVEGWSMQNRFVGDTLLYGGGNGWGYPEKNPDPRVYAYAYKTKSPASAIKLAHNVDRIEPLGSSGLVVGTQGNNLHFTTLQLQGDARIASTYVREGASQGELRSHGFFFKPATEDSGLMGLPVMEAGAPGYEHLQKQSAYVLFLRSDKLALAPIGSLKSELTGNPMDGCRASCTDWYGNTRPIFIGNRVFALLGYELVEGQVKDSGITEVRRTSFAPPKAPVRANNESGNMPF